MRRVAGVVLVLVALPVLVALALLAAGRFWPDAHWQPALAELEQRYGIRIHLATASFPDRLRRQGTRYRLTLPFERASVLRRLAVDLARYPDRFVSAHLDGVVILRSLEIAGRDYGGTYDVATGMLFLDADWLGDDGDRAEAMGLHHEFSSLLLHRHAEVFDTRAWAALNPPGFSYRFAVSSAANLDSDQLDLVGDADTWSAGFLCAYGRLTVEDDINTFAQYLLAGYRGWPALAADYPPLVAKMRLLAGWYAELGAVFDGVPGQ